MAREQNIFYQDPTAAITNGLGRAFFGDPAARAQQQQMQAEAAEREARRVEANAHANVYSAQADGLGIQNEAARSLPDLIAKLQAHPAAPMTAVGDSLPGTAGFDAAFDSSVGPAAHPQSANEAMRAGLPAVIAAMGQMNGDKVDPTKVVGSLASFLGGDEMARRGLIAQGQTPGANFAITPERADAVAARDAAAKQATAWGTARINHASDVPVANIQAGASRYGADQRLAGTKYTADARGYSTTGSNNPGNIENGDFARSLPGYTGGIGRFATFATPQDGENAQAALLGSYVKRGFNTPAKIANRWAPAGDGHNDPVAYAAALARAAGIGPNDPIPPEKMGVVAAAQRQLEGYRGGSRGAWARGGVSPAKPPKQVSPAAATMLKDELDKQLDGRGQRFDGNAKTIMRGWAEQAYQSGTVPADAVRQAIERANDTVHRNMDAAAHPMAERPPPGATSTATGPGGKRLALVNGQWVSFARRAPDGKWYVQAGKHPDGSPAYSQVNGW